MKLNFFLLHIRLVWVYIVFGHLSFSIDWALAGWLYGHWRRRFSLTKFFAILMNVSNSHAIPRRWARGKVITVSVGECVCGVGCRYADAWNVVQVVSTKYGAFVFISCARWFGKRTKCHNSKSCERKPVRGEHNAMRRIISFGEKSEWRRNGKTCASPCHLHALPGV